MKRNPNLPKMAVDHILTYVEKDSLPECYSGVYDWLCDFYPDLNWNEEYCEADINNILGHPEFPKIQAWFVKKYGFDFKEELYMSLDEL